MIHQKVLPFLGVVALISIVFFASRSTDSKKALLRSEVFDMWVKNYNKQYLNSEEHFMRYKVWSANYDIVQEHNAKNSSWELEVNEFADFTDEEFSALFTGISHDYSTFDELEIVEDNTKQSDLPQKKDWRQTGTVSSVRNQGICASGFAFSAAAALEGLSHITTGDKLIFSPQQLVDCSKSQGNAGCSGGSMSNAFRYTKSHGIQLESTYAYSSSANSCAYNPLEVVFINPGGVAAVAKNNASELKKAVSSRPVSVFVQSSSSSFKFYKSGIVAEDCGTETDHGVLAVGYDISENGQAYWIVKNSWGENWGENGYIRIAAGQQNEGAGVCGINSWASFPY